MSMPTMDLDDEDELDRDVGRLDGQPAPSPLVPQAQWLNPPTVNTGQPFAFGYGGGGDGPASAARAADHQGRSAVEEAAARGDLGRIFRVQPKRRWHAAYYCAPDASFVDAATMAETSLLEAVWAVNALEDVATGLGMFGHIQLLERLAAETRAPLLGTPRHRTRLARRGAALLQDALLAAIEVRRVDVTQRLIALVQGLPLPNPCELVLAAVQLGDAALVSQLLAVLPSIESEEAAAIRKASLTRIAAIALHRPYRDILPLLYRAGADPWESEEEEDNDNEEGNRRKVFFTTSAEGRISCANLALAYAQAGERWGPCTLESLVEDLDPDGVRWALGHGIPVVDRAKVLETMVATTFTTPRVVACALALLEADFPVSTDVLATAATSFVQEIFDALATAWTRAQRRGARLPKAAILKGVAGGSRHDLAAPFIKHLEARWGIEVPAPTLCALVDGEADMAVGILPLLATNERSLATTNLFRAAVKAGSIPLIHRLRQLGLAWPAKAVELARGLPLWQRRNIPLLTYLSRHRCPRADVLVTDADRAIEVAPTRDDAANLQAEVTTSNINAELWPVRDKLATLFAPAYGLAFARPRPEFAVTSLAALPLGGSRLGGLPDLPPSLAWPHVNGKPLTFVIQINLDEIAATMRRDPSGDTTAAGPDDRSLLPRHGWLWYFCDFESQDLYRGDVSEPQALLFWDGGAADQLVRQRHPHDGAVDDDDLAEFGTGLSAHQLTPSHIVTPQCTEPDGFTEDQASAIDELLESNDDDGGGGGGGDAPAAGAEGGAIQRLVVAGPDGSAGAPWTAVTCKGGLQLLGHHDPVQSDVLAYVPESVVREFAGLEAAERNDNDEDDAAQDEDEDEDEGEGEDEDEGEGDDADEETDENDESDGVGGGPHKDVLRSIRRHNARLARQQDEGIKAERAREWMLLLQIPSVLDVRSYSAAYDNSQCGRILDHEMSVGTFYVCMRRTDMVAHRFDKTFLVYQQT